MQGALGPGCAFLEGTLINYQLPILLVGPGTFVSVAWSSQITLVAQWEI